MSIGSPCIFYRMQYSWIQCGNLLHRPHGIFILDYKQNGVLYYKDVDTHQMPEQLQQDFGTLILIPMQLNLAFFIS